MAKGRQSAKRAAILGMLTAAALILGWLEHIMPISAVPGIKLGLSNVAVLLALYMLGDGSACTLMISKVLLTAILFGGFSGFLYSASGGVASLIVMLLLKHTGRFSPVGISAAGGAAHITAQIAAGVLVTSTAGMWYLLAPLLLSGTLTGVLTGALCSMLLCRLSLIPGARESK